MKRIKISRPSPALVVAMLALVAAVAGTAIAANPVASTSKLTTKSVKKIAAKEIKKAAPTLSVASAAKADALSTQTKLAYQAAAATAPQVIFDNGNLKLTATCAAGPALTLTANTAVDNATLQAYGTSTDTNDVDFDIAESPTLSASDEERDAVYTTPSGQILVFQFAARETGDCHVRGLLQAL